MTHRICLLLFAIICSLGSVAQTQKTFLLYNVQIVDVNNGSVTPSSAVLVEKGKISAIGQSELLFTKYKGVLKVDGGAKYLIPGLWDMHVHMMINCHSDYPYWDK